MFDCYSGRIDENIASTYGLSQLFLKLLLKFDRKAYRTVQIRQDQAKKFEIVFAITNFEFFINVIKTV